MRIIKLAIISVFFFSVLLFLMSLLVPSQVRISKAINLAKEDSLILKQVQNEQSWPAWHPAYPNGIPVKTTIKKQKATDSLVVVRIDHPSGNSVTNSWALHRFGAADSLTLQWYMDFRLSYLPWHRFSSLFYEATYGRMMEQGLRNIKNRNRGEVEQP